MAAHGESGWLALDASGHVVGHTWRIDSMGSTVIRGPIPVEPGWAYLHYGWVDPTWRGQGILPALMCNSMLQALTIDGWSVRGFSADIVPTNVASQRSVAKLGFVPVRRITSLRIYQRWFVLHSGPAPEDVRRRTGA
jgi:RimJ/RimL family protein N-acetyltransferase